MPKRKNIEHPMTDEEAMTLVERDRKAGKPTSTQASHFVHEEMEFLKKGLHKVRSRKQAIAIGLAKARKYGIPLSKKPKNS